MAHELGMGDGYHYYEGNFSDNKYTAQAVCKYPNGRIIKGNFFKGFIQGGGYMRERDGAEYLLTFKRGVADGRIVKRDLTGEVTEYFWKEGKKLG